MNESTMLTAFFVITAFCVCSMTIEMVAYHWNIDISLSGWIERTLESRLNKKDSVHEYDPDYVEALGALNGDEDEKLKALIEKYDSLDQLRKETKAYSR